MIDVRVDVDTIAARAFMEGLGRQTAFAVATAMNRSAEDANAALRRALDSNPKITFRDKGLLRWIAPQLIKGPLRATKQNLRVILETEGKGRLVNPLETGELHTPDRLGRFPAVPTEALRPTRTAVVPRQLYPANLGLQLRADPKGTTYYALGRGAIKRRLTPFATTRGGKQVKRGKLQTYELPGEGGRSYIFQRTGRKQSRLLWVLLPTVPRPRALGFERITPEEFERRWPINLDGAWELAMRTAR